MHEIAPGLRHWSARHPDIGLTVSSYALPAEGVLLNPLLPGGDRAVLAGVDVRAVVLTNGLHRRDALELSGGDVALHVPAAGAHRLGDVDVEVRPYADGDELPGGLRAVEVGVLSPDEFAVHLPAQRALAIADGVMRRDDGPLGLVPAALVGDDPDAVHRGLAERFLRLCDELDVEHLLLAHGAPVLGDGEARLRRVAEDALAP